LEESPKKFFISKCLLEEDSPEETTAELAKSTINQNEKPKTFSQREYSNFQAPLFKDNLNYTDSKVFNLF
jgi:hypothetical protein